MIIQFFPFRSRSLAIVADSGPGPPPPSWPIQQRKPRPRPFSSPLNLFILQMAGPYSPYIAANSIQNTPLGLSWIHFEYPLSPPWIRGELVGALPSFPRYCMKIDRFVAWGRKKIYIVYKVGRNRSSTSVWIRTARFVYEARNVYRCLSIVRRWPLSPSLFFFFFF